MFFDPERKNIILSTIQTNINLYMLQAEFLFKKIFLTCAGFLIFIFAAKVCTEEELSKLHPVLMIDLEKPEKPLKAIFGGPCKESMQKIDS